MVVFCFCCFLPFTCRIDGMIAMAFIMAKAK